MNRTLSILILLCFVLLPVASLGQCAPGRYISEIFPSYTMDSVTYSVPYSLKMDIYQPAGDALPIRPLIILAHGGSFIDGGREGDSTILTLCQNFAKRGYVTASIDYRLDSTFGMFDSATAVNEIVRAICDGKAAIRFFRDSTNQAAYRIDTNNIFIGGNSAGAILYLHAAYLDSFNECTPDFRDAFTANGGFDGNSGYSGHSSKANAVINLAGALHSTEFAGRGDMPSVNAQGDSDVVIPYDCGYPNVGLYIPVTFCGLGALEPIYATNSIYHMSHVFHNEGHVPWASSAADFMTVDSLTTQFLYSLVCAENTAVTNVAPNATTNIFPNPATEQVAVRSSEQISEVTVVDNTGRVVTELGGINSNTCNINTARLSAGMYFIKVRFCNQDNMPLVSKLVVEK